MANSSNSQQNRSRNRNRNRNHDRRGTNSGGGQRRFVKQKVPRRARKPSIWEKFCALFGFGNKRPSPPKRQSPDSTRNRSKKSTADRGRERKKSAPRTSGPFEKVPVTTSRLYVGNLSYSTTENDLETLFEKVGGVVKAEIVYHRGSNRSKGYAFVEMDDTDDARKAADTLHDHEFMGRKIMVNGAKSAGPQSNQSP